MVLFALVGYAGHAFLGIKVLFPIAVVLGLLIAPLVPVSTGCAAKAPDDS